MNIKQQKKLARLKLLYLDVAIRLMPEMAEAYFSVADIYRHQEKNHEAVLFYEKGLLL